MAATKQLTARLAGYANIAYEHCNDAALDGGAQDLEGWSAGLAAHYFVTRSMAVSLEANRGRETRSGTAFDGISMSPVESRAYATNFATSVGGRLNTHTQWLIGAASETSNGETNTFGVARLTMAWGG